MKSARKVIVLLGSLTLLASGRSFAKRGNSGDSCESVRGHYQQETQGYRNQIKESRDKFVDQYGDFGQFFNINDQPDDDEEEDDDSWSRDHGRGNRDKNKKRFGHDDDHRRFQRSNVRNPMNEKSLPRGELEAKFQDVRGSVDADLLDEYDQRVHEFFITLENSESLQSSIENTQESYRDDCYSPAKKSQHNLMKGRFKKAFTKIPVHTQERLLPLLIEKILKLIEKTENSNMAEEVKQARLDALYALLDLIQEERGNTGGNTGSGNTSTGNALPTISSIADKIISEDSSGVVNYVINDANHILTCTSSVAVTSSNTSLLPLANIIKSGNAPNCLLTLTPVANLVGTSHITVVVTDASGASDTEDFLLTVQAQNDDPVISTIPDLTMTKNTTTNQNFTITDTDSIVSCKDSVSVTINNTGLVQNSSLTTTGAAPTCTLSIEPITNAIGTGQVTVMVTDGSGGTANESFVLTVSE